MEQTTVDLTRQKEWESSPGEVKIPEAYIRGLRYEIVVFARKERGGNDFTFRCREYKRTRNGEWRFIGIMQDTSIKDADGNVKLARYSYHPEVSLVNIGFMVYPAPEADET